MNWNSIKDIQPEVGQRVLVYWVNTAQNAEHIDIEEWNGMYFLTLNPQTRPWIRATHWMELPQAPDAR